MDNELIVNRYIIHFLDKEAKKTKAEIDLSKHVLSNDEFSNTLTFETHKAISESSSLKNTHFRENEENSFTNSLHDYLSSSSDEEFYSFSETITKLKETIEKESLASGGYYFFVDYSIDNKRFISVVLLRKKSGLNIKKVGDTYQLDSSENINIDKVAMAFRLNLQIFESIGDDRNYIALITTQQNGIVSGYFRDWVSAGDYINNDKNTEKLITIIKSIDLPKDDEGLDIFDNTNDFQKAVFEYARPRGNRVINLRDMGQHFYGENNESIFLDFAEKNGITIDPEFKRDSSRWRNLVTVRARVAGIELNVDYNKLNKEDVVVENNRIIINSKTLVDQINHQIQSSEL